MARAPNALDLLRRDHKQLEALLRRFNKTRAEDEQRDLCEQITSGLKLHTEIEEQAFYPFLREATGREDLFQEATIEHGLTKDLLQQIAQEQPGTPRLGALMKVLAELVHEHIEEEEAEIFPQVEKTGVDLKALGEALEDCRNGRPPERGSTGAATAEERGAAAHKGKGEDKGEGKRAGERTGKEEAKGKGDRTKGQANHRAGSGADEQAEDDQQFLDEHGGELSRSTQHAKWVHTVGDKPDHDGQTLATRNIDVIRAWAEARDASPATSPNGDAEHPRVLRFDFPGYDKRLQPVSWEAWAGTFERRNLVFLYQENMAAGNQSNFFRLDNPEREDA